MRALRLVGFLALAGAAVAVFLLPQSAGSGLDRRIPGLLVILVLVVVWHFVSASKVREYTTTEVVTEEIITEIDLPRPAPRPAAVAPTVVDLTDGALSGGAPAAPHVPQPPDPPAAAPLPGANSSGLPPRPGNLHGGPLPPGPAILRPPGSDVPGAPPGVPPSAQPAAAAPIQPTEVLPPSDEAPPIRPTDEQFDLDAPAPGALAPDPPPAPPAPVVAPLPAEDLTPALPAPDPQPQDAWTMWAADLFGPGRSSG